MTGAKNRAEILHGNIVGETTREEYSWERNDPKSSTPRSKMAAYELSKMKLKRQKDIFSVCLQLITI